MKNKFIKCITLILMVLFTLSGCTAEKIGVSLEKFAQSDEVGFTGKLIAENDRYIMGFDDLNKGVYFKDKQTTEIFTSNPKILQKDENSDVFFHPQLRSDIAVDYVDKDGKTLLTAYSFLSCVSDGNVVCEVKENGCIVTYYFNEFEFSVPIDYTLKDDGISVSVDPSKIKENTCKVLRVSVSPFMCSVKNDSKNSYLFIPSGSGAIAYPKTVSEVGNVYSQYVYGEDATVEKWTEATEENQVLLPVFGAKRGDVAVCGVISEGAANCKIDALIGGSQYQYSTVYATFDVRASSPVKVMMYGHDKKTVVYSDGVIKGKCTVDYYPLYDNDASYSGMAKLFREKSGIDKINLKTDETNLNLIVYGGCVTKKSFFGIPYDSVYAATTLKDVEEIIGEISSKTSSKLSVLLKGFGSSAINIGTIGGGYSINSNLGTVSQLKEISKKYDNTNLYFDFDVVRQEDNSWFSFKDTAKSLNNQTVYQYEYGVALRDRLEETRYSLLSRKELNNIPKTLLKKTEKWDLQGISFASLSKICYSDNNEYIVRNNMETDVSEIFKAIKEKGKRVASVNANYYAAKSSDIIFETPFESNKNEIFSVDIPFYQIVFKGSVPMTSSVINHFSDENVPLLKAVESGIGITYGIYKNYDSAITDAVYPVFASGTYEDIKEDIISTTKELSEYYDKINKANILNHSIIDSDLRLTEFDNGIKIYVNYSANEKQTKHGVVKANSWLVIE